MAMTAMATEQGIPMAANKRNATPIKPRRSKAEKPRRAAGAHSASTSLKDRLASWREHHRDSLRDALHRINLSRASSTMTILVIAIALSLPAGLAVALVMLLLNLAAIAEPPALRRLVGLDVPSD